MWIFFIFVFIGYCCILIFLMMWMDVILDLMVLFIVLLVGIFIMLIFLIGIFIVVLFYCRDCCFCNGLVI